MIYVVFLLRLCNTPNVKLVDNLITFFSAILIWYISSRAGKYINISVWEIDIRVDFYSGIVNSTKNLNKDAYVLEN